MLKYLFPLQWEDLSTSQESIVVNVYIVWWRPQAWPPVSSSLYHNWKLLSHDILKVPHKLCIRRADMTWAQQVRNLPLRVFDIAEPIPQLIKLVSLWLHKRHYWKKSLTMFILLTDVVVMQIGACKMRSRRLSILIDSQGKGSHTCSKILQAQHTTGYHIEHNEKLLCWFKS